MSRFASLAILSLVTAALAINRSVYKIQLTQKGFAQFVQYDLETPPIREFTFCVWIRVYDFEHDQSIFTYIVNGNNRILRLWLDSGGRHIRVSFRSEPPVSIPVDIVRDVWRHVCLSYQSDYGAWALYMDSRLLSCEVTPSLHGFVFPPGGSVVVGYGTTDAGNPNGLEGEIFGVNMILFSTIERNFTLKNHPKFTQKAFRKNRIRGSKNIDYIILKDLQAEELHNAASKSFLPQFSNKSINFFKIPTANIFPEHDVGIPMTTSKSRPGEGSNEMEILEIVMDRNARPTNEKPAAHLWSIVNEAGHVGKFKTPVTRRPDPTSSETQDRLTISEHELPPPLPPTHIAATTNDYLRKDLEVEKPPPAVSIYKMNEADKITRDKLHSDDLLEVEVPPPLKNDNKVYGQWTSSKYAGSVLNYLKSINFYNKEKKVPTTIPLTKVSDNFPYSSDLKPNVVKPPTNIQRKKIIAEKRFHNQYSSSSSLKHRHLEKRDAEDPIKPEINVKIVTQDLRTEILKSHAQTQPRHVEITSRGETKELKDNRLYRDVENYSQEDEHSEVSANSRLAPTTSNINNDQTTAFDFHRSNSLFNVLPFLKSVEYFTGDESVENSKMLNDNNDMYTRSFSMPNKWHNIKSYNNDYTPRRTPTSNDSPPDIDQTIAEANKKNPTIRLKYKPETNKVVSENNDEAIVSGRQLAMDVSNQSKDVKDAVSILKYNHGYLPGHKPNSSKRDGSRVNPKFNRINGKNNFDKQVKLGNALNERHVIGTNEEQNKKSFIGGDEKVPDIQKYRSDIDKESENVPSSLKLRACKNSQMMNSIHSILYVQPDGSIDTTNILSPLKIKNIGIEFVVQNYQKCSLEDSLLEKNYLLLINWDRTPVRVFGGATPRKTKDLCGFF